MKRIYYIICYLLFCNLLGHAQIAPVYSNVDLGPPIFTQLNDIVNTPNQLKVQVKLLDATAGVTQIYLKLNIQGGHIHLQSREGILQSYDLHPGSPLTLTNSDLYAYFNSNNLLFRGMTHSEYVNSGQNLPFGTYKIWIEVYEVKTKNRISLNEVPAFFTVVRNDPPLIISPIAEAQIESKDNFIIPFNWTPRHLGGVPTGYTSIYEFELLEIPKGFRGNLERLFGVIQPFYFERTSKNFIYYDYSYPLLNPNCRYAFRVRAICEHNTLGQLHFQNNGYSEISCFYFKEECPKIKDLFVTVKSPYLANISWTSHPSTTYIFSFKKSGEENGEWFDKTMSFSPFELTELEPSTTYLCKLLSLCSDGTNVESETIEFTTMGLKDPSFWCGNHRYETFHDQTPLTLLRRFDTVVTYSGFKMIIGNVSGENGTFSGDATLSIPFWANTGINFKFKNIFVNKNHQLVRGKFTAVGGK